MEINLLKKQISLVKLIVNFLFLTLILTSCNEKGVINNQSQSVDEGVWNEKKPITFEFSIKDTIEYFDVYLTLRNDENYRWSNIYLFSDLTFPNGKTRRDTIEITLADKYGNWLGNNSGTIITTTSKFINHRKFPLSGDYKIDITHGMRIKKLENVLSVGLKIKQWEGKTK